VVNTPKRTHAVALSTLVIEKVSMVADALDVLLDVLGIEILVVHRRDQARLRCCTGGQDPDAWIEELLVR